MAKLKKLTSFLDRLDKADLHYSLASVREDAVMVGVTVDDQHWEVEFAADGEVEVEIFSSDGELGDESALDNLFKKRAKVG